MTNSSQEHAVDISSAFNFANSLAFITSHELCEAFTDRDSDTIRIPPLFNGFTTANGCEIGDICETRGSNICCNSSTYSVDGRIWQSTPNPGGWDNGGVEQYWSNSDNFCIDGFAPVRC